MGLCIVSVRHFEDTENQMDPVNWNRIKFAVDSYDVFEASNDYFETSSLDLEKKILCQIGIARPTFTISTRPLNKFFEASMFGFKFRYPKILPRCLQNVPTKMSPR